MINLGAALLGYLIGSLPTANTLAGLWGIDLRTSGSGNPGANNARRLGGPVLALLVFVVEVGKGALAVFVGMKIAGDLGAVLAGTGAAAGNVYNVWYRFQGGKGLSISFGVLLGAWPTFAPIAVVILGVASAISRSTGIGSLVTLMAVFVGSIVWDQMSLTTGWGVADTGVLIILGIGLPLNLWQRHWADARARLRRPVPL